MEKTDSALPVDTSTIANVPLTHEFPFQVEVPNSEFSVTGYVITIGTILTYKLGHGKLGNYISPNVI